MKRLNKEEQLNILATLKKANRLVATPGMPEEQLIGILTKCQSSAITLGEALERYGEAGETIIRMLEEYCEALYLQSQNIGNEAVLGEFQRGIDALLNLVEQETEKLPLDKKVVVFLPYKASMWDSLESVWKAAGEDLDCDAYVVPIPYYDRNPDKSFGEMHYEGDEYPSYVPITSWEEFSIPDMKPDAIYIHNPYDELNYVTSVHPAFYASKLKNYTKELVYIPYFVLNDNNLMTEKSLEHIEQYCMQPGVIHAHKVIVQSEAMKEAYVEILARKFGEETRASWEAKIFGLGSPKFDKVNSMTEEDVEIPEEWKPVLFKPDGSRRKVILYNTSVGALINHNEKMLSKMRDVFQTFYEAREEIALLWRPHPLIKATIESMRPRLWEEYEKLVNEYRDASWGIYDDTADLNRAIALADAYYGDGSSLVQLCQEKDMPVMVQNVDVTEVEEDRKFICPMNFLGSEIDENGRAWLFDRFKSRLCSSDVRYQKIRIEGNAKSELGKEYPTASQIYPHQGSIYITSQMTTEILEFDIQTRRFTTYKWKEDCVGDTTFYFSMQKKESLLLFPSRMERNILIFDMQKKTFEERTWKNSVLVKKYQFLLYSKRGENVWASLVGSDYSIRISADDFSYEVIRVPEGIKLSTLCVGKDGVWFSQLDKKELLLYKRGAFRRICLDEKSEMCEEPFSRIYEVGKKVVLLPRYQNKIYIYDAEKEETDNILIPEISGRLSEKDKQSSAMYFLSTFNGNNIVLPSRISKFYLLDLERKSVKAQDVILEKESYFKYCFDGDYVRENAIKLSDYIIYVKASVGNAPRELLPNASGYKKYLNK